MGPKRFTSVDELGHLFCTDLCWIGEDKGGIVQIAKDLGISVASAFGGLGTNGCSYLNKPGGPNFLEPECGWQFTNYASAAALEEVLRCDTGMAKALKNIKTSLPIPAKCPKNMVADYRESLTEV